MALGIHMKEQYIMDKENRLRQWRNQVNELTQSEEEQKPTESVKPSPDKDMEKLRAKYEHARQQIEQLRQTDDKDTWDQLKTNAEETWDELETMVKDVIRKYQR